MTNSDSRRRVQDLIDKLKAKKQMTADREHGYDHLVWLSDVEAVLVADLDAVLGVPEGYYLAKRGTRRTRPQFYAEDESTAEAKLRVGGGDPQWQPIETAPKDGTHVLLRQRDGRVFDGQWDAIDGWPSNAGLTHWLPMPTADVLTLVGAGTPTAQIANEMRAFVVFAHDYDQVIAKLQEWAKRLEGAGTVKCDCGAKLTHCVDCAVAEWQAAHPNCIECCPIQGAGTVVPPPHDPRKDLIEARNNLLAAIVKLRGGHAAVMDDCDEAIAALDIAIGKSFATAVIPPPSVSLREQIDKLAAIRSELFKAEVGAVKEGSALPPAGPQKDEGRPHDWRWDEVFKCYRCNACLVKGDAAHGPICPKAKVAAPPSGQKGE